MNHGTKYGDDGHYYPGSGGNNCVTVSGSGFGNSANGVSRSAGVVDDTGSNSNGWLHTGVCLWNNSVRRLGGDDTFVYEEFERLIKRVLFFGGTCKLRFMKIAYFYRLDKFGTHERFVKEAETMGHELVPIKYRKLSLKGEEIFYKGEELKEFGVFYFRAVGSELEWSKLLDLYAKKHGIPVVDEYLNTQGPLRRFKSVMGWQLFDKGVNYPKTVMVESFKELREELTKWEMPVIVKLSKGGRHGMGTFWIRKMEDLDELEKTLAERARKVVEGGGEKPIYRGFLVQEFIPNDGDYRMFLVGYKTVGGFKRMMKEEKLVLNKSVGHSMSLESIPDEVKAEAEAAAAAVEVEVAGIDMIKDSRNGKVYVVEVNEAPEFTVMERRTKKNIVKAILEFVVSKKQ